MPSHHVREIYAPYYSTSHALLVGIDNYQLASPLSFAGADAQAVADCLTDRFGFRPENVNVLIDGAATKVEILKHFYSFAHSSEPNDRLLVFFAGHGHTVRSPRGEVGWLVPCEGDPEDLSTLIRWDDLTRGADLIPAKHVLLLMDACYGGLAITRRLKAGSMRFLKDMLVRTSRQVLAAGKADETVSDQGGPLPGHSPFTGHLLEALAGKAADTGGVLTANGVMAYVYQAVSQDPGCCQTPHYGYTDGDGDLVFAPTFASSADGEQEKDEDVLVSVPVTSEGDDGMQSGVVERMKEHLSEDRYRLKLYEVVASEVRRVILATADDQFAVQGAWSNDEFISRVDHYNEVIRDLACMQALLGYWALAGNRASVSLALKRLCDRLTISGGTTGWLALRWYPSFVLLYSGGIAAVASERYDNLREMMLVPVPGSLARTGREEPMVLAVTAGFSDVRETFKVLPGHERQYTPASEYLHKLLQPMLDDTLFLGGDYERAFDRFEILLALQHAHEVQKVQGRLWGPFGRFGWKHIRGGASPLTEVITEAQQFGNAWPPIESGLFDGSADRFSEAATWIRDVAGKLGWW